MSTLEKILWKQKFIYANFVKADVNLLAAIIEKYNNGKPDSRYISALTILDYIGSKIKFQQRLNKSAIVSREELEGELFISGKTLTFCLNLLENTGLVESTRQRSINGVKFYKINYNVWYNLAREGKKLRKCSQEDRSARSHQILEESINKINKNLKSKFWTGEQLEAINKMAYDRITEEDVYQTALNIYERLIIQLISKSFTLYTGRKLLWSIQIFNGIRKQITDVSKTNYKDNPEEYVKIEAKTCVPQRLIDIGKFLACKNFNVLTKYHSNTIGLCMIEADKNLSKIIPILYSKNETADDYYKALGNEFENKDYYLNPVEVDSNFKVFKNPIDLYYNEEKENI